jgi:hypothetical protein
MTGSLTPVILQLKYKQTSLKSKPVIHIIS